MKPSSCRGCPLEHSGEGFVPPQGVGRVLLCGEAPGATEARLGVPFVGAAGVYLDRTLHRAGIPRSHFTLTNTLWCRPPGNKIAGWESAQRFCHTAHMLPFLKRTKPTSIVALGAEAMEVLTGQGGILKSRGYVLEGPLGIPTIGSFHPAFLMPRKDRMAGMKDPHRLTGALILDLKAALNPPTPRSPRYLLDPYVNDVKAWVDKAIIANLPVMFDIETPGKAKVGEDDLLWHQERKIIRIGFAQEGLDSLSIPWEFPYIREATRLMESGVPLVGWNSYLFDEPILNEHGVKFAGFHEDAMWMWHFLQSDLPRGLSFVGGIYARDLKPWKHLSGSAPAFYNAQDVEVTKACWKGISTDLASMGMTEICDRHVRQLFPILRDAGRRGNLIDPAAQAKLRAELEAVRTAVILEASASIPPSLHPRKAYKRLPKNIGNRVFEAVESEGKVKVCSICGTEGVTKSTHLKGGKKNPCHGARFDTEIRPITTWEEVLPFNIGSTAQMMHYAHYMGHEVGRDPESGRPTLDALTLKRLAKSDALYQKVLDFREADKTAGTFIFPADVNNLIHTTYTFAPSTGRLSSRDVNLQNVSHHARWSGRVRETIIVPPGMVMLEADSAAIEAVMTGYFANDPDYIRLAKEGIHDYLTCLELGLPFDTSQLKHYRKTVPGYEDARNRNKRAVHGTNYGMTPRLMAMKAPEIFPNTKAAKISQQRYLDACPKLAQWQDSVRSIAANQGYLQNPWGYRHYYYHIYDRRNGITRLGEDAKRCVSFLPQSSAAAFQKDNALILGTSWLAPYIPANFLIHDSYCVIIPESREAEAHELLVATLTRPILELEGLRIGCEVKRSTSTWNDLRSVGVY